MTTRTRLLILSLGLALAACGGLPRDFESLPLQNKVDAYVAHFQRYGRPLPSARSEISWHGWDAANLMAAYVSGERKGLPIQEAIEIIHLVQTRGCSLKGSVSESALEEFLTREPADSLEHMAAKRALEVIQTNRVVPGGPDILEGGPCQPSAGKQP